MKKIIYMIFLIVLAIGAPLISMQKSHPDYWGQITRSVENKTTNGITEYQEVKKSINTNINVVDTITTRDWIIWKHNNTILVQNSNVNKAKIPKEFNEFIFTDKYYDPTINMYFDAIVANDSHSMKVSTYYSWTSKMVTKSKDQYIFEGHNEKGDIITVYQTGSDGGYKVDNDEVTLEFGPSMGINTEEYLKYLDNESWDKNNKIRIKFDVVKIEFTGLIPTYNLNRIKPYVYNYYFDPNKDTDFVSRIGLEDGVKSIFKNNFKDLPSDFLDIDAMFKNYVIEKPNPNKNTIDYKIKIIPNSRYDSKGEAYIIVRYNKMVDLSVIKSATIDFSDFENKMNDYLKNNFLTYEDVKYEIVGNGFVRVYGNDINTKNEFYIKVINMPLPPDINSIINNKNSDNNNNSKDENNSNTQTNNNNENNSNTQDENNSKTQKRNSNKYLWLISIPVAFIIIYIIIRVFKLLKNKKLKMVK